MKLKQVKSLTLGLGSLIAGLALEGGHLKILLSFPAALLVFGGTAGAMLMSYSFRECVLFIKLATGSESPAPAKLAAQFFRSAGQRVLLAGGIGFLLGLVHVFSNLATPDQIGRGVAASLLCPLYALLAKLFLTDTWRDSCQKKADTAPVVVLRRAA